MSRWFKLLGVLLLLNLTMAAQAVPLRIMPVGDSITAGYTDNPNWNVDFEFGYRSGLYNRLTAAGYDIQFVGGSTEPFDNAFPGDPLRGGAYTPPIDLRTLGQNGHRGYGGVAAPFLLPRMTNTSGRPGWLMTDNPDIVLLHIGTNGQFANALDELVSSIVNAKPEAHLLVATIIPKRDYLPSIDDYNPYINQQLKLKYETLGSRVTIVDHYNDFLLDPLDTTTINPSLFATGNHPNGEGYDVMAANWFAAIEALNIPEPSTKVLGVIGVGLAMMRRRSRLERPYAILMLV